MNSNYQCFKTIVETVTGFSLPEAMPEIGKQVDLSIPNFDVYQDWKPAKMVYLGGERLFLKSPTTGEEYRFNGIDKDYISYEKEALRKREQERFLKARKLYSKAVEIDPKNIPELAKYKLDHLDNCKYNQPNEDISPIGYSELKKLEGKILQAFYTDSQVDRTGQAVSRLPQIIVLKELGKNEPIEYSPNLPFCHHVHRYAGDSPIVWVVGYNNAILAMNRLPDFSVKEVLNVELLANYFEIDRTGFKNNEKNLARIKNQRSDDTNNNRYDFIESVFIADLNSKVDHWFAFTANQVRSFNSILNSKGVDLGEDWPFGFIILDGEES